MKKFIILGAAVAFLVITGIIFWFWSEIAVDRLIAEYNLRESFVVRDRNEEVIFVDQNPDEFYAVYEDNIPQDFADLLVQKEDHYFYFHPGVNPVSTVRAIFSSNRASSTITQQLAKILLNHEQERTLGNKAEELMYAFALEARLSKKEILEMYINSVYFGNQVQGINAASMYYFDKTPEALDNFEKLQLLATISSPSNLNPFTPENEKEAQEIGKRLGITDLVITDNPDKKSLEAEMKERFKKHVISDTYFEYKDLADGNVSRVTLDSELTRKIRGIINEHLIPLSAKNATHAAVVVIKYPENELIAVVGSPDPASTMEGDQINMAVSTRPIGSTIKPLLYAKGFSEGLRPYSLVDDREYKYTTAFGQAIYPKNYDYQYRGIVTLHESLSNSLNVPSVKVLEFIGLENFYSFLLDDLGVVPVQDLDAYQYGIALGHLEMSLLDLCHKFTILGNKGMLKPLEIEYYSPNVAEDVRQIIDPKYIQLVNIILNDRDASSDQFGMVGNLHVPAHNVAVKTGTSREYHDSWTVGYTPDFLVGVWVGNTENTAMDELTGQQGAGDIWNDVMSLLIDSGYNQKTGFDFSAVKTYQVESSVEYGLKDDDFDLARNMLLSDELILFPHDGDEILYEEGMSMGLEASKEATWYADGDSLGYGKKADYKVVGPGRVLIRAVTENGDEENISVNFSIREG